MKLSDMFLLGFLSILIGLAILPNSLQELAYKGLGILLLFSIVVGIIIVLFHFYCSKTKPLGG